MTSLNKTFHSKILMFGEYTVTNGSGALAIPLKNYQGYFHFDTENATTQESLIQLKNHIEKEPKINNYFDFTNFETDLQKGLFFKSNIPIGYGLGSSGAFVASFYNKYGKKNNYDISVLKQILLISENAFHGSSSGIDPLVSYLNQTVEFTSSGNIKLHENVDSMQGYFLIDTGISRETATLVQYFKSAMKEKGGFKAAIDHMTLMNQKAIKIFLENNNPLNLWSEIDEISLVQYEFMQKMIPVTFKKYWKESLESDQYRFKLCGAGGGGMILGATLNKTSLDKLPFIDRIIFL